MVLVQEKDKRLKDNGHVKFLQSECRKISKVPVRSSCTLDLKPVVKILEIMIQEETQISDYSKGVHEEKMST